MVTFEKAPPEARQLLPVPIRELGLRLESTHLAPLIEQLYEELDRAGLHHFRPLCYLSDEWGCPSGQPVIGIPWYLADHRAAQLENELNDLENEREVMMFLRHEAGHAFNYAYDFYKRDEWRELFGPFRRPYRDDYAFVPFSRDYVRHIAGWYAQKHPDEDFAETFAVWLDPSSHWRVRYAGWGALRKIEYIDRIAHQVGDQAPLRTRGEIDVAVEEMEQTVEEYYRKMTVDEEPLIAGLALDTDLIDIFILPDARRADVEYYDVRELLADHRRTIVDKVNYWTGVRRTLVRALAIAIERRSGELGLLAEKQRSRTHMIDMTVYIATLAMTFLTGPKPLRHRR
jgi:hypothetical protein